MDSCIHAVNSTPRYPWDVSLRLRDDRQHLLRSLVFRAEAQKAVADVDVDSHVRRALQRKIAHTRVDEPI